MDYLFIVLFLMVLIMLLKFRKHVLMILISMEFFVMINLMLIFCLNMVLGNIWMFLYFLVFSVCEGVLGLVILISLMYHSGNLNLSMCSLSQ